MMAILFPRTGTHTRPWQSWHPPYFELFFSPKLLWKMFFGVDINTRLYGDLKYLQKKHKNKSKSQTKRLQLKTPIGLLSRRYIQSVKKLNFRPLYSSSNI